jgi:hypothetical protein
MLGQVLYDGFASAHRRVNLILLDILWKAAWGAITMLLVLVYFGFIAAEIQSIQLDVSNAASVSPIAALVILREFWTAYSSLLLTGVLLVTVISAVAWCLMESYFRSRLLPSGPEKSAGLFLASGVARSLMLGSAASIALIFAFGPLVTRPIGEWASAWPETRGVMTVCVIAMAGFAFVLTVADTLIRSNAVSLLGSHMFQVTGVIGTLFITEACIGASAMVTAALVAAQASNAAELLAAAGLLVLTVVLLSAIHSYLLLVRFFSIDIMRRDVIDV